MESCVSLSKGDAEDREEDHVTEARGGRVREKEAESGRRRQSQGEGAQHRHSGWRTGPKPENEGRH